MVMRHTTSQHSFDFQHCSAEDAWKPTSSNVSECAYNLVCSKMKKHLDLCMDVRVLYLGLCELCLTSWSVLDVLNNEMAI